MVMLEHWTASINGPSWFYGFDIVFLALFVIINLIIYKVGVKAYGITRDRKYKNFSLAFFFISLAYLILGLSNLALYTEFYDGVVKGINFANWFYLAYIFFMLVGYSVLLLVSMKVRSKKLALLMFGYMLLFIAFAYQYYLKFHLVALMMLVFIAYQFWENYLRKKSFNSGLVFVTFYLLVMAEAMFLLQVWMPVLFVVAFLLQLTGYLAILTMYVRVLKNG
ncbi:MAG: hypothetical protein AABY09_04675 [Nanoarchaeota archaeon]